MSRTSWNDREDDALHGLPHLAQLIYLRAIRPHMDYASGIVGIKRGISLKSIAEALHVEHGQGRREYGDPTLKAIRYALELLERKGLIVKIPADRQLVFRLPMADTDQSVSEKWGRRRADVGQTKSGTRNTNDDNDLSEKRGRRGADQEREKWGTPPKSVYPVEEITPLPPSFVLPASVDKGVWAEFEAHRREIRKPLTDRARAANAKVLEPLTTEQQQASVNASIANRWTGLFPPKVNEYGQHQAHQSARQRAADEIKAKFASHDWSYSEEMD